MHLSRVFPGCFMGVSRVFPGCSQAFFLLPFTLLKIPTTFAKEFSFFLKPTSLIQNISKCIFPGCFPGVSRVFPGCFLADRIPAHLFNIVWHNVFHDIRP